MTVKSWNDRDGQVADIGTKMKSMNYWQQYHLFLYGTTFILSLMIFLISLLNLSVTEKKLKLGKYFEIKFAEMRIIYVFRYIEQTEV